MNKNIHRQLLLFFLFIAILLVAANLRAAITAVGPLVQMIVRDARLSNPAAGLLTSLPLLAFALISPIVPGIAKKIGIERALLLSMLLLTAGILLRSLIPNTTALFVGTIILGAAIAAGNVLLPGLVKNKFTARVGMVTGLYTVSMALWAGLSSGISASLVEHTGLGWRGSLAFWSLLSLLAALCLIPVAGSGRNSIEKSPGEASRQAFGVRPVNLWQSPLAWESACFMGIQSVLFYVLAAWFPAMLTEQGLTMVEGGWLFLLLQIVSLPASFIAPILASRSNDQVKISMLTAAIYAVGFFGLLSERWTLLWVICLGIGGGAAISLALSFFTLRTRNGQQAAELSGMSQAVGYLLAAAGPVVFGAIHDLFHSWSVPNLILGILSLILIYFGYKIGQNRYISDLSLIHI